jgi:glycosyltransferase involved in cell wall biosynthesis
VEAKAKAKAMKVLHIGTFDVVGGAAIAAYRLHQGLQLIGTKSQMLVADKRTDDETIVAVPLQGRSIAARLRRRFKARYLAREVDSYRSTRDIKRGLFSDDRTADASLLVNALPYADIYNLHWVAGFVDYRKFFRAIGPEQRVVWTLHDMYPFTGGCHYSFGCDNFVNGCGACPALGSKRADDLSSQSFRRKRDAFSALVRDHVAIMTPSRWMAREAQRSALFGCFDIHTIPYGVNTATFAPRDRQCARDVLGIPSELTIVMFVADWLQDHRKGIDLLSVAINELGDNIGLLSIGRGFIDQKSDIPHFSVGGISNERLLSFVYSAADLLICPTRQDNLPNVILEAMACGIPAVAFDVGGVGEVVRDGRTGVLVAPEDVSALIRAVRMLITDDELRTRLSAESRMIAVTEYPIERQAERYRKVYERMLESRGCERNATLHCEPSVLLSALPEIGKSGRRDTANFA